MKLNNVKKVELLGGRKRRRRKRERKRHGMTDN